MADEALNQTEMDDPCGVRSPQGRDTELRSASQLRTELKVAADRYGCRDFDDAFEILSRTFKAERDAFGNLLNGTIAMHSLRERYPTLFATKATDISDKSEYMKARGDLCVPPPKPLPTEGDALTMTLAEFRRAKNKMFAHDAEKMAYLSRGLTPPPRRR